MKAIVAEIALILLVNFLCGALMLKIGLEIGYGEAMETRAVCIEEAK